MQPQSGQFACLLRRLLNQRDNRIPLVIGHVGMVFAADVETDAMMR
jgi:hypothetical protein